WAAADTASQIQKMLFNIQQGNAQVDDEMLQAKDIAVLVRDHSQAELVKDELKKNRINCVTHSRASVFKSEEARLVIIFLQAVAEPASEQLTAAALSTPLFGYSGNDLFELQKGGVNWANKLGQFYRWHRLWEKHGFSFFFQSAMQEEKIAETVIKRKN